MGIYTYIDYDRVNMRKVKDKEIQKLLDEALQYDETLMISEYSKKIERGWFRKPKFELRYTIYHECYLNNGLSSYEAREQLSGSGKKEVVMSYLYGIINGVLHEQRVNTLR